MDKIDDNIWTKDARDKLYEGNMALYQNAILEQYKIYVEMADRVSQRRGKTNDFFLTINMATFSILGLFFKYNFLLNRFLYYILFCCCDNRVFLLVLHS